MSNAALSGTNVSFYQVTLDGSVLAQAVQVTRSDDNACTWPASGGEIVGQVVTDLFPDPNDATRVVAIVALASGSYLIASHDGGQTFVAPPLYQTNDLLTAVEISRSTPGVMYATSNSLTGSGSNLLKSTDSGATWTSTVIPTDAQTQPLILAIDPEDSNTVYLRIVSALTDSIHGHHRRRTDVSDTHHHRWSILFFSPAPRTAPCTPAPFLGQLYVRPPGATAFTNHPAPHFRCLGQRPGTARIFACGDMNRDGFSLGYSDDDGGTFTRIMNFTEIQGPLTCSPVATNCVAHWARIQQVLGISDGGGVAPGGPDAGPDGGPDAGPGKQDAGPGGFDAGPEPVAKSSSLRRRPDRASRLAGPAHTDSSDQFPTTGKELRRCPHVVLARDRAPGNRLRAKVDAAQGELSASDLTASGVKGRVPKGVSRSYFRLGCATAAC